METTAGAGITVVNHRALSVAKGVFIKKDRQLASMNHDVGVSPAPGSSKVMPY